MPGWLTKLRSVPFGAVALLAVATTLYVALLANAFPVTGGEDRISQAFGAFFLTLALWLVLALLLIVSGVRGEMPRWTAYSAIVLHPLAGLAEAIALDAVSRNIGGAMFFVALLPLVIAGYAMWARLTVLHKTYPPQPVSAAAWGAITLLTIGGMATGL